MCEFKLNNNEDLVLIKEDIKVKANENNFTLTLFLTNERLVLLKDVNKELSFNNVLKANGVQITKNNQVVFTYELKNIKDINYKDGCNYITLDNNNKLILFCRDLTNLIKSYLNFN